MYRLLVVFFTVMAAGLAQMPGPGPSALFPAGLKQYLALTDPQIEAILRANSDDLRYQAGKQLRVAQVQREIAEETARDTVDPMALGLRYMELESIRRELRDSLTRTQQAVVAVLNDTQKQKLKTLEDAAKLQSVISEARCENLLPSDASGNLIPASRLAPIGAVLVQVPMPACITAAFRTGDFTASPGQ